MKKRVLLLDTGREWGGGTNSMFELLKRIDRERFDISAVFYHNYRKGELSDLRSELAAIGIPFELMPAQRQPLWAKFAKELVRGPLSPWPSFKQNMIHVIERCWRINPCARAIAERLLGGKFDLLYMNNQPSSNLEGYLAGEIAGVPVVQHCRSNARLGRSEVAVVNRVAQRLICVSAGVRDSLIAQGVRPNLCAVVHNAIDVKQVLPEAVALTEVAADAVVIGSVGSLLPRKSNDHLIRAAALVKARGGRPFHIVLLGDGPERARLEHLVAGLGLTSCVSFAGFRPNALAWEAAMDIIVLASDNEGFPRVILEAMLLAKPVIASDVVGSRELVKHGSSGFLYPYGDEEALANRLQQLLEDADLRRKMGAAGHQDVLQNHAIERYVRGVEEQLQGGRHDIE
ncbi:glycosyltransferase [Propionivibrio sp.]|uniref:glycosyltransferase n=1 Tax=Propionivibrio sp. TaxID=2212460 RepID=UPI002606D674|nr:glycosyltransferase [Propionivibrio sp.]